MARAKKPTGERKLPLRRRSRPAKPDTAGVRAPDPAGAATGTGSGTSASTATEAVAHSSTASGADSSVVSESDVLDRLAASVVTAGRAVLGVTSRALSERAEDVTPAQFRALAVLGAKGERRLADLAADLSVTPSTVTRMCERLVRKDLAVKSREELDRREVAVALTEAGRQLVDDVTAQHQTQVRELLAIVPENERIHLYAALQSLINAATSPLSEQAKESEEPESEE